MAAVIRLKRPLNEEPSETLILNCKRRKTDAATSRDDAELSTVLKFTGTINNQEEIYSHLRKPSKIEIKEHFKRHNVNLSAKLRSQKQEDSKRNRYKVVNCFRSQNPDSNNATKELNPSEYTIYDVETDGYEEQPVNKNSSTEYVYDVYYSTSDELGDAFLEDYVNMYPYSDVLIYGSMKDNGINRPDSDDESEDSNAENNWRNDYPDESDMESVKEDDMVKAMKNCDLSDLSSDDCEDDYIYGVDSESSAFEEDLDESDIQRHGLRYAKFKAKHKKEVQTSVIQHDLYYGDIDEEEYYY